ncbi:DEAD/DEAH box helicase [Undibacterium sp. RTI2.1]|uniref:DEAD/DEAH box helicase n=1 Tax=unclassified Undibacterium TaxID=2630295 RepID=UPI002B2304A8|nr:MULTISPECIES: DEAD/DEAH box helicase [unclassified Undibacterium]MEB0029193.1 DEAD/DEAH box helicase [Undibacterium sp. RTI2.1]MEB0115501.1 DEAD/DEAH box helicase [Undibacterium sp. RTI2.2]
MTQNITIASNATTAKLHDASREVKLQVQTILSYAVEGAEHAIAFKRGSWDGRSSFMDFRAGTFPAGFVQFVSAHLRKLGYKVNHVRRPLPAPLGPENPVVDAFLDDPRYDYQMEVVRCLAKHGQIIARIATGGGKSRIARLAFARFNMPTLFLTTRGLLMYQMRDTFEKDLGIKVSVLGDGQFGHTVIENGIERQAVKKMSVGMVQTLIARLEEKTVESEMERMTDSMLKKEIKESNAYAKKLEAAGHTFIEIKKFVASFEKKQEAGRVSEKLMRATAAAKVTAHMQDRQKTINLLGTFGLVILEEAHEASGNSYYEILRHCKNAYYRLALTATPFMKDSEESNMRLMACSGPIGISVSEETLIDRGILAQPHFKIVELRHKPAKLMRNTGWQSAYRIGITDNEYRNKIIVDECIAAASYHMSTMVLIQQTKHGETLLQKMTDAGLRVAFIQGEDDQAGRKQALSQLAKGEIDVLIGSTILDVGVDVPAVGVVIIAGGGKAEVALRQRIGRGLREKKSGPNIALIIDFADGFNEHLKGHAMQRLAIIKATPGFDRYIHERGAGFDYEALGFKKLSIAA